MHALPSVRSVCAENLSVGPRCFVHLCGRGGLPAPWVRSVIESVLRLPVADRHRPSPVRSNGVNMDYTRSSTPYYQRGGQQASSTDRGFLLQYSSHLAVPTALTGVRSRESRLLHTPSALSLLDVLVAHAAGGATHGSAHTPTVTIFGGGGFSAVWGAPSLPSPTRVHSLPTRVQCRQDEYSRSPASDYGHFREPHI